MDFIAQFYLWIKAIHVMAVIAWMAGLFYLPRLFVRHVTHAPIGSEMSEVFKIMENKLYRVIMNPAMMTAWICGILMIASGVTDFLAPWFLVKFVFVIAMTIFHIWCKKRLVEFAEDSNTRSSRHYRFANEVPTILMIVIVIMVIVKPF